MSDYKNDAVYYLTLAKSFVDDADKLTEDLISETEGLSKEDARLQAIRAQGPEIRAALACVDKAEQIKKDAVTKEGLNANTIRSLIYFTNGRFLYTKGTILRDKKILQEAIENYKKALVYEPDQATLYNIALAMSVQKETGFFSSIFGSTDEIDKYLEEAVKKDPYSEIGLKAARKIIWKILK